MNIPICIIFPAAVGYPWDETESMPSVTGIPPQMCFVYEIEGIWCGQKYFRDDMVSKMIEELYGRQIL